VLGGTRIAPPVLWGWPLVHLLCGPRLLSEAIGASLQAKTCLWRVLIFPFLRSHPAIKSLRPFHVMRPVHLAVQCLAMRERKPGGQLKSPRSGCDSQQNVLSKCSIQSQRKADTWRYKKYSNHFRLWHLDPTVLSLDEVDFGVAGTRWALVSKDWRTSGLFSSSSACYRRRRFPHGTVMANSSFLPKGGNVCGGVSIPMSIAISTNEDYFLSVVGASRTD
jgi:hypothetical protein